MGSTMAAKNGSRTWNQSSGEQVWCVMGIETLYSAAHAAGFAMVGTEEAYEDLEAVAKPAVSPIQPAELQWQPSRGVLMHATPLERPGARGDWIGVLLGMLGRRPAPRRPALTAEA
jgi:hypothetical protein